MISEATNNGLRDDNDTLHLPAWTTKRELFRRWAFDRGFILTTTDAGNWKKRTRADFEGGKELVICSTSSLSCCGFGMLIHFMTDLSCTVIHFTIDVIHFAVPDASDFISWGTFLNFWSKYYSHLVIRKRSSDICND